MPAHGLRDEAARLALSLLRESLADGRTAGGWSGKHVPLFEKSVSPIGRNLDGRVPKLGYNVGDPALSWKPKLKSKSVQTKETGLGGTGGKDGPPLIDRSKATP